MNANCYKTIFSERLGTLVAVGEHATAASKTANGQACPGSRAPQAMVKALLDAFVGVLRITFASVAMVCLTLGTTQAQSGSNLFSSTLPQGGSINTGSATIGTQGAQMTISQTTDKASINWQSFNIGSGASVNITQPSASSVLLNRVVGNDPSQILGKLSANGQVILINPNGIVFGKDGSVTASAFTASTFGLSDADFMDGLYKYKRNGSTASVVNQGKIETTANGFVALMGATVTNEGIIHAPQGDVLLVAAENVTLPAPARTVSVPMSKRVRLELDPAAINTAVKNTESGVIVTEGGQVLLQAAALSTAVASVTHSGRIDTSATQAGAVTVLADGGAIKVNGSITANSSGQTDGKANLGGDIVIGRDEETGALAKFTDVSGAKLESDKGFVETSGDVVSTSGTRVKAGEWLLDPNNITIAAGTATGTNYSNYTSSADSTIFASDISANLSAGTSVTLATGAGGTSNGDIAVNENISKTGGADATLKLLAHGNVTVAANKTISSNTAKLNVVFNSDSDATSGGGMIFNSGSGITSNGGNITLGGGTALTGAGFAIADGVGTLKGISLTSATINAGGGNIVMNGQSAASNYQVSLSNVDGIYMSGGSISTTGSGTIDLTGKNQNTDTQSKGFEFVSGTITGGSTGAVTITGDSRGVASSTYTYIRGALIGGTVTSAGGNISITGYGGAGVQYDYGVDLSGSVTTVGSGTINITGTAGAGGSGGNVGVITSGTGTISSVNGAIAITGTGGLGSGAQIRDHGVQIGGTNAIRASGTGDINVTGTATNNDNGYSQGVLVSTGGLNTNSGNIKIDGKTLLNYQVAANISAAVTSTTGNVHVRSAGANITNTAAITGNNISIDNTGGTIDANGVITSGAGGASTWAGVISQNGIDIKSSITATNNINIYGNQTGLDAGVKLSGAGVTVSGKNITLYGKSSTGNGVLLSGSTLSGAYLNATGFTNTGYTGFAWQGGTINTTGTNGTSTASVIKGISAASTTASNGYGALMMIANSATNAASGTTLTLAGEATTLTTGQNIKERGILVQGGYALSASGDITLDGSSKSSEGMAFGGTINMATVAGVTNKLTLKGTSAASSNAGLSAVNFSGVINGNDATSSINILGTATNTSGASWDNAINIAGAINGGGAPNIIIQSTGAKIQTSAAITGANISIDNTNGTINTTAGATNGAITTGTANSGGNGAISIGSSVMASGNLNIYGASSSNTGIQMTATGAITGANIQATGKTAGANGITMAAGANVTTTASSGDSLITAIASATNGGGGGAFQVTGIANFKATTGSTLTLDGQATGSAASASSGTRGMRIDGGATVDGTIAIKGSSKSADGLMLINGVVTEAANSTLSLFGTTAGNGGAASGVAMANSGGVRLNNGATLAVTGQAANTGTPTSAETAVNVSGSGIAYAAGATASGNITITGTSTSASNSNAVYLGGGVYTNGGNITVSAQNPAGGSGYGVNVAGAVNASGNVTIQTPGSSITQTGATITAKNVSIDATNGTVDAVTGAITAGTATTSTTNGTPINLASTAGVGISASGNINIVGTSAGTQTTVELNGVTTMNASGTAIASVTGEIKATGASSVINVTGNKAVNNTAMLTTTTTGAAINLTSTTGGITGSGSIGSSANKGASVTFTSATTSTYSGAINETNFTKAGAGSLSLASWVNMPFSAQTPAQTAGLTTTISNAYTVKGGGELILLPGATYATLAPVSVNVENASKFSIDSNSNSRWNNTAFHFTGGSGGGTINLGGNPIGYTGTSNTFSTSGGTTNTITGMLNGNSANVNFNLTSASSGTALVDGSFASIAFTQSGVSTFGMQNVPTTNVAGGGSLLFKDKLSTTNININAGTVQMGDGSAATSAATADLVTSNVAIATGAKLIFNRAEAYSNASTITGTGSLIQAGTGIVTLTGDSSAFAGATTVNAGKSLAIGNGGSLGAAGSTVALANSTSTLAFSNTSGISTVGSTISGAGNLSKSGAGGTGVLTADNSYAGTTTVSGGTLQVGNGGSTGTLGVGDVTLSNNATLSYVRSASTTIANTISGAGHVSANITGAASDLTVNRSINLTDGTVNLVTDGNLSVNQAISTTNATASAVFLESGKPTAAGTATEGDIKFTGSGAVTVGSGGRATYMTGSILGSTGMGVLAGNSRYNSDELTTNYTAALGSGAYAIYREQPLVTVQVNNASKTYDGIAFNGGSLNSTLTSGALANGDTFSALTANVTYGGSSQGTKNASATPYVISASDTVGKNALGYGMTYAPGSLTINKANLTVTANPVTKTYDGTTNAMGTGTVAALAGAAGGDVVNNAGTQAFLDANAGANKTVRATGVTIKDAANADMTGNYNISYVDNTTSLINKANLTVTAIDDARFVGRSDSANYAGVSYTGFVNGETSSVLGGNLAITRSNASTLSAGVYPDVLSPSGLTSGNYNIAYATGTYTIVPANQLLIRNNNINTTYGSSWTYDPTAQYLDGNNDTIVTLNRTNTGSSFTFSDGAGTSVTATLKPYAGTNLAGVSSSGNTVVGNYSIKDISPTVVGGNFVGAPVFAGNLSVNTKAITPNASGVSKVYDSTTAMTNVQVGLTGEVTGDNLSISGSGAFSQKNVGTGLNYTIANIALSGADAGNYHLSGGSSSLSGADGVITAAPLVLTTSNVIKIYDGNTSASGFAVATQNTQLFGSDSLSGGAFAFTHKNAGTGNKVVEVSAVTVNDGNNGQNYTVTYANNTSSTIHKAALTLTANSDTSKVYNGTEQSVSGFAITSGSLQGSDSISVDLASITAGAKGTHAGTYTSTVNDASYTNGNYAITKVNGSLFIDQKEVSLAATKTYDGNKTLTGTQLSITTGVGTETLGYSNATINSKNVADNSINFVNAVTLIDGPNGALANDYKLPALTAASSGSNTAVLSAKVLIGSIADVITTYGTSAGTGAVSLIGKIGADDVQASSAATLVNGTNSSSGNLNAGSYAQTVSTSLTGADANNYSFAGLTTPTANYVVNKLALTGSIAQGVSVYGSGLTAGTVNLTNKVGSDDVHASGVNIDTSGKTSTSGNLKAGDYTAIQSLGGLSGVDKDNYSFADVKGDYKVNKLALTGAAIAGVTTTYATAADAGTVSFGNVQVADKVTSSASIMDAATSTSGNLKAGSYNQAATAITGDDASNYSFAGITTTDNNYVVNKLTLTGAAIAGVTTTYATAAGTGAVTFSNVQGSDKVTSAASIVDAATSTSGNLKAGNYNQTATAITGDDASNYSFAGVTTADKNYVVNKLTLTGVTIAGVTTTYATAADAGAVSFGNVQLGDKVTASASIVDAANSSSGNLRAGSYKQTATAITGDDASNYSFAGVTTTDNNYVVNKLTLTGAAIAGVTTTYATAAGTGAVTFGNVQSGDKVTSSATIMDAATSTSSNLKAGSYKQIATTINGDDASNYSFAGVTTTDNNYVVNKLTLTGATIAGVTTTYATAADAGAVSFGNVQVADKVTSSASIVDAATSTSGNLKAGSYKQTATAISGDDASNYSFAGVTTADKNYVVNKLTLTGVTIAGVTTTYATAADAGNVSFGNVQLGDKVTSSASIVDAVNSTSGNLKAGSYKQTATAITGDDASNYSFAGVTTTDNNYVVNKLTLTGVTIAGVTTTYATAADAGTVSFGNVQSGDKVASAASIVDATTSTSGNLKAGSYKQIATTINGDDASNYSFSGVTTTDNNYVVNKLALTGTAIAGVTTTYATAADTGAVTFSNVQGIDKVTSAASIVDATTSTSGNLKAGSYKQVATTINGDDASNYSFSGVTTTDNNYVVNKLALTKAAIAGVTTTYATAADAGTVSFGNVQVADKVTASASIVDAANSTSGNLKAGSYKQTATAISGDDASNYSFAGVTTTDKNYVVDPKAVTLSGLTAASKAYDGNTHADIATENALFSGVISGDKLSINSTGAFSDKNAATGKAVKLNNTLGGADMGNYSVTDQASTTADIRKKDVTLSGITAANKTYDGNTDATIISGTIATGVESETLAISGTGTFSDKNAGINKLVTVNDIATLTKANGTGHWDNYNLTSSGSATTTASINPKNVSLDSVTAANKMFDGTTDATITSGVINTGVGTETLSISGKGDFSDPAPGKLKTVTVKDVKTLTKTNGTGDWNNYNLSTTGSTATKATITAQPSVPVPPISPPPSSNSPSRLKVNPGATPSSQLAFTENFSDETCLENTPETCFCEPSTIHKEVLVCYKKTRKNKSRSLLTELSSK
ncbi:MAG: YDG domain-containing protein [Limnohabitans sp.]